MKPDLNVTYRMIPFECYSVKDTNVGTENRSGIDSVERVSGGQGRLITRRGMREFSEMMGVFCIFIMVVVTQLAVCLLW